MFPGRTCEARIQTLCAASGRSRRARKASTPRPGSRPRGASPGRGRAGGSAIPRRIGAAGQVGRVPLGRAGGDPVADRPLLAGREPGVVGELAVLGRGVPGGHPTLIDDLGDHARPAGRLAVVGQGERGDLARAVAGDAVRLEDAGDLSRVGHGAAPGRLRGPADLAADRVGPRRRDRPPGEDGVECVDQVVPGGRADGCRWRTGRRPGPGRRRSETRPGRRPRESARPRGGRPGRCRRP